MRPCVALRALLCFWSLFETGAHSNGALADFTPPDCAHVVVFRAIAHVAFDSPAAFMTALGSRFGDTIAAWVKMNENENPAAHKCATGLCDKRREVLCVREWRLQTPELCANSHKTDCVFELSAPAHKTGYVNLRYYRSNTYQFRTFVPLSIAITLKIRDSFSVDAA